MCVPGSSHVREFQLFHIFEHLMVVSTCISLVINNIKHLSFDQAIPLTEISLKDKKGNKTKKLNAQITHYLTICNNKVLGTHWDRVNGQQSIHTKETL